MMKIKSINTSIILFTLIINAAALVGCSKISEVTNDSIQDSQIEKDELTFYADCNLTKTNLAAGADGVYNKMVWSAGDQIGIFDAQSIAQPFTTTEGGANAAFTGKATVPSDKWYAFYPYNAQAKLNAAKGLVANIPEVQYAKANGISDNVTLLYAECANKDNQLTFKHACALIGLTLPEPVVSVTLEVKEDYANFDKLSENSLAGSVVVNYADGNVASGTNYYPNVSLWSAEGGEIPAGKYYLAIRPIDYAGTLILTLRDKNSNVCIKEINGLKLAAGQILPVNVATEWKADTGVTIFGEVGTNYFARLTKVSKKSPADLVVTGETFPKLYGKKSTKWTFTDDWAWSNRLTIQADKPLKVLDYIDKGFELEFYIKCEQNMLDVAPDLLFELCYKYRKTVNGAWDNCGKLYPETLIKRGGKKASKMLICDTQWHRVSFPLISKVLGPVEQSFSQLWLDPRFDTPASAKKAIGATMYIDEIRIVSKQ